MHFGEETRYAAFLIITTFTFQIQDRANDGTGAYPSIVSGGIGDYYIEIQFTSQLGRSIDFNVEIYGR